MTVSHRIKKECHLRVQFGDWKGVLDLDVISFSDASGIDTVSSAVSKETVPWVDQLQCRSGQPISPSWRQKTRKLVPLGAWDKATTNKESTATVDGFYMNQASM